MGVPPGTGGSAGDVGARPLPCTDASRRRGLPPRWPQRGSRPRPGIGVALECDPTDRQPRQGSQPG
eukprot:13480663-Alexandrium_andersonii.AAC.1